VIYSAPSLPLRPLLLLLGGRGLFVSGTDRAIISAMSTRKSRTPRRKRPDPSLADTSLAAPCECLPGTKEKQELMQARVAAGLPAIIPGDVVIDPARARDYTRLRNGYDRLEGEREDRAEAGVKKVVSRGNTFRGDYKRLALSPEPDWPALGPRLRALRHRRGLSLGQVSLETGLSRNGLSQLERGVRSQPHLAVLWRLADLFRISIDELVGRAVTPGRVRGPAPSSP
jgi:DNA-binding XRE family transcriptional regulator